MIQTYIRDEALKAKWDINSPAIRPLHQSIVKEWIETADTIRTTIREGETQLGQAGIASETFDEWLYGNVERISGIFGHDVYYGDSIMVAYLEWGVRNYPITDRITEHTLAGINRMYDSNDPETMIWEDYTAEIGDIIQYQTERNGKPIQSMSREEMLRRIQSYNEDTLRKMLTAVEYQQTA